MTRMTGIYEKCTGMSMFEAVFKHKLNACWECSGLPSFAARIALYSDDELC